MHHWCIATCDGYIGETKKAIQKVKNVILGLENFTSDDRYICVETLGYIQLHYIILYGTSPAKLQPRWANFMEIICLNHYLSQDTFMKVVSKVANNNIISEIIGFAQELTLPKQPVIDF